MMLKCASSPGMRASSLLEFFFSCASSLLRGSLGRALCLPLELAALDEGIDDLDDLALLGGVELLDLLQPSLHARVGRLGAALGGLDAQERIDRDVERLRHRG